MNLAFLKWEENIEEKDLKMPFLQRLFHVFSMLCLLSGYVTSLVSGVILPPIQRPDCFHNIPACVPLSGSECFGVSLPYQYAAPGSFAPQSASLANVSVQLQLWSALRNVPQCWEVIQPLLCAVYLPRCQMTPASASMFNITSAGSTVVQLPSRELCDVVQTPCRIIELYGGWPDYLRCDQAHFNRGCSNDMLYVKYNTSSRCMPPLVATSMVSSWYPNIDGCGLQCRNPMFTDTDHNNVHTFVAIVGSTSTVCTLFAVLTFILDWKSSSRYPVVILFFMNVCFLVANVGWMAQFIPGARRDIVCRSDGTIRAAEPQIGVSQESPSCTVVFVLVYYFSMAGVIWFALLAYAWHLSFRAFGSSRDVIEGRRGHFHLMAWSLPLVLTIVCLAVTQVDGDSISGVCFVGNVNFLYRAGFVLAPVGLFAVAGLVFLIKGLITLIKIQTQSPGLLSAEAEARIRETIIRIGIFAFLSLTILVLTVAAHLYVFMNKLSWQKSLSDYLVCLANSTTVAVHPATCRLSNRPSLAVLELNIFAFFATGIVISLWVWQKSTFKAWKLHLRRLFFNTSSHLEAEKANPENADVLKSLKPPCTVQNPGRSSLSILGLHDDFGPKFDLTSVSSRDFSSLWSAALPYMASRRSRAPTPAGMQPGRLQRRHSDSDLQSITSIWTQMSLNDPTNQLYGRVCDSQRISMTLSRGVADVAGIGAAGPVGSGAAGSIGTGTARAIERGESEPCQKSSISKTSVRWHRRNNRIGPTFQEPPDPSLAIKTKKVRRKDTGGTGTRVILPVDERLCKLFVVENGNVVDEASGRNKQLDNVISEDWKRGTNSKEHNDALIEINEFGTVNGRHSERSNAAVSSSQICVDIHAEEQSLTNSNDSDTIAAEESEVDDVSSENNDIAVANNDSVSEIEDGAKSESSEYEAAEDTDIHSTSNYSIASSDTAALSIRLDENYEPIDPPPTPIAKDLLSKTCRPPAVKAVVKPMDSARSSIPTLQVSASLPTTTVTSLHSNCATQTSMLQPKAMPEHPFPLPHFNMYPPYGYGSYMPTQMPYGMMAPEASMWPPYGYLPPPPPPPPWFYHNPYFDIPPYFQFSSAPPYYGVPTDLVSVPNSGTPNVLGSSAQTSEHLEPGKPVKVTEKPFASSLSSDVAKSSVEQTGFKPKATNSQFIPSVGSLFKPINAAGKQPALCREVKVDKAYSQSLLEMVELVTPNFETGSSDGCEDHNEDYSEDDDDRRQRTALEEEEELRLRIRRRHTRQWIRALQTDFDDVDNCADSSV